MVGTENSEKALVREKFKHFLFQETFLNRAHLQTELITSENYLCLLLGPINTSSGIVLFDSLLHY